MNDKFKLGALFPDNKSLELDIKTYEKENFVNLWKKHSRSIASEIKRNPNRGQKGQFLNQSCHRFTSRSVYFMC